MYWLVGILSLIISSYFPLIADHLVYPAEYVDMAKLPPLGSNILKAEREHKEQDEYQQVKTIVQHVVDGDKKQLDRDAQLLANNKQALSLLLDAVAPDRDNESNVMFTDEVLQHKRVTLSLHATPLADALALVADLTQLSLSIDPSVTGTIPFLRVDNEPLGTVLSLLLEHAQPRAGIIRHGGVYRIVPVRQAHSWYNSQRDTHTKTMVEDEVLTIHHARWSETFKLRIETLWEKVIQQCRCRKHAYLVIDDETRKLFFAGCERDRKRFKTMISSLDTKVPVVKIEARLVLADKRFEESFGLQWSGIYNQKSSITSGFGFVGVGPLEDIKNDPGELADLMDWTFNLFPTIWEQTRNFHLPFVFGGPDLTTRRLNTVLNAAENRQEIKTLLKPTIVTSHKEVAEILEGEVIPIETIVEEAIEGRLRNVRTAAYKDVGIQLRVRPEVNPDTSTVLLDLFVENSMVAQESMTTRSPRHGGTIYPTIITTRSKTRVLLASGQTTMIGGLIKNRKSDERSRVPFLSRIPILGNLFKGYRKVHNDVQLLIFITPTVIG